jgi:hypothetical protein
MSEIKDLINQLVKRSIPVTLNPGIVLSVDKSKNTSDVELLADGSQLFDVKLKPIENANGSKQGIVIYPELKSYVIVGIIDNDPGNTIIVESTLIESVLIHVSKDFKLLINNKGELLIDAKKTIFNGGKNKGLVKIEKLVDKINRLENKMDSIITNLQKPVAIGVPVDIVTLPIVTQTEVKELENSTVQH